MRPVAPKPQRCAVYTRKSTEHNLDLAFYSLDAQREACEAYIKSQAHEGWALIREKFDDGGLSGASLERPALQALLDEVRSKKIDIIVVYKVDRLTRSLADFAKLVELFDAHDVSFVSVTQSFNTTSSMGRLTLNVLLSFAQFEREVIGERVRDKIAASKRKGIWVGGPVPLGYRSIGKKLEVVPEDAALVRKIFADYVRLGSIGELAAALDKEGIRPKPRYLANGTAIAAERFMVGPLAHLLKNRFYVGEVVHKGEVHKGEHEPILDRDLFEAVQTRLAEGKVQRKLARSKSPAILMGLIFDDRGNPMSPSHANKKGVRYRYYVSHALLQNRKDASGSVARVSAPDVEALVCNAVKQKEPSDATIADRELIKQHIERIIVRPKELEILLRSSEGSAGASTETSLSIPFAPNLPRQKGITHPPPDQGIMRFGNAGRAFAGDRAGARLAGLDSSREAASFDDIAAAEKSCRTLCPIPDATRVPVPAHHKRHRRWRGPVWLNRIRPRSLPAAPMDRPGANARTGLGRAIRSWSIHLRLVAPSKR